MDGYASGLAVGYLFAPGTWLVPRKLKDCRQVAAHCSIPCLCLAERDHDVGKLASRFWSRKEQRGQKLLTVGPSPFGVRKLNKPVEALIERSGEPNRDVFVWARAEPCLGTDDDVADRRPDWRASGRPDNSTDSTPRARARA